MAEVIELPVVTKLDTSAERVVQKAAEADLEEVCIVGFDKDGDLYFASNIADAGSVLWQLEMAKYRLLKLCEEGLTDD